MGDRRRHPLRPPLRSTKRALTPVASTLVEGDEPQPLERTLDRDLANGADSSNVVLVVDHPGLKRRPLLGPQRVVGGHKRHRDPGVQVENLEVVLSLALEELLTGDLPNLRMPGDQYPGAGAMYTSFEGSLGADGVAVPVELLRGLPEIPHVAVTILSVEVVRHLIAPAMHSNDVVDHRRLDAQNPLGPMGHLHDVNHLRVALRALVAVLAPGLEREEGIVDAAHEIARAEGRRPPRPGSRLDRTRRLGTGRSGPDGGCGSPSNQRRGHAEREHRPAADRVILRVHCCPPSGPTFSATVGGRDERTMKVSGPSNESS